MSRGGQVVVQLISPATTPGSTQDEERCLTYQIPPGLVYKQKWKSPAWNLVPCYILSISIVQVLCYILVDDKTSKLLRFDPDVRWEAWRFVSYMLLHWGKVHLALNIVIQCLLAVSLEVEEGGTRTVGVYLGGGVFGALGAYLLQPQLMVGASAGVYALLTSHLSHLYLNFQSVKYKSYRVFAVCMLAGSDIGFCVFHTSVDGSPSISLGAHGFGGLAGILLGLTVYKVTDGDVKGHRKIVPWCSLVLLALLLVVSVVFVVVLKPKAFQR